jgi:Tfp pilus assembly protein PilF
MEESNNHTEIKERLEKAGFYILNQKYSEALKILKEVVAQDEASPEAHYLYGLALEGTNQQEEAKNHFRRVLELVPDHDEARQHLDKLTG